MTSFRLTVSQCNELSDPQGFRQVLQTDAVAADSVPAECREMMRRIIDYFASESRFHLPPGDRTDFGTAIRPPSDVWVVTCLTRHDAQAVRSRIRKRKLDSIGAERICESYNVQDAASRELARQCIDFLQRQADVLRSDDDRLLVVVWQGFVNSSSGAARHAG